MDPISFGILSVIGGAIISALATGPAFLAPVALAAGAAGPIATVATAVGVPLAAGSLGTGAAVGGAVASQPSALQGIQAAAAEATNNFNGSVSRTVNGLNLPFNVVPH